MSRRPFSKTKRTVEQPLVGDSHNSKAHRIAPSRTRSNVGVRAFNAPFYLPKDQAPTPRLDSISSGEEFSLPSGNDISDTERPDNPPNLVTPGTSTPPVRIGAAQKRSRVVAAKKAYDILYFFTDLKYPPDSQEVPMRVCNICM